MEPPVAMVGSDTAMEVNELPPLGLAIGALASHTPVAMFCWNVKRWNCEMTAMKPSPTATSVPNDGSDVSTELSCRLYRCAATSCATCTRG